MYCSGKGLADTHTIIRAILHDHNIGGVTIYITRECRSDPIYQHAYIIALSKEMFGPTTQDSDPNHERERKIY